MKKLLSIIMIGLLALSLIPVADASVLIKINNKRDDHANTINLTGLETLSRTGKEITIPVVDSTMIAVGAANGDATSMTTTDLAVPVGYAYVRKAIAADSAFTAGTLADGKPGQLLTIHITEDEGSEVFTVTPTTSTGFESIGFDAVGEIATFLYLDDTYGWTLFGSTNATINLP